MYSCHCLTCWPGSVALHLGAAFSGDIQKPGNKVPWFNTIQRIISMMTVRSRLQRSVLIYFTCFQDEAIPHKSSVTSCSTSFSTSLEFSILCSWGQVWQRARLRGKQTPWAPESSVFLGRHLRDMLGSQEVRDILTVVRKQHDLELKQSVSVSNSTITRCPFSSHLPTSGCC